MLRQITMRLAQIRDFVRSDGWSAFFREVIYFNRTAFLARKYLAEIGDRSDLLERLQVKFLKISPKTLAINTFQSSFYNRFLKALSYLEKGYTGYAIARNNTIIGDIWCFTGGKRDPGFVHPDVLRFKIPLAQDDAYLFDMFVVPSERKNGISAALQGCAMYALLSKGYHRVYGYYWADNIPALWTSRIMNRWEELKRLKLNRFLLLRW